MVSSGLCAIAGTLASCETSGTLDTAASELARARATCAETPLGDDRSLACHAWACGRAELAPARWDGDARQCRGGVADTETAERAIRIVNAYRSLAGVPTVRLKPPWNIPAQACAIVAHANNQLSHTPPREWVCWSELGAQAAAVSLLANRGVPVAVDAFIMDRGNESSMVHRRWLLSEKIGRLGVGSTNSFSCMLMDGRAWDPPSETTPDANASALTSAEWVAWPPGGKVPLDVFRTNKLDTFGWTIQSSSLDLDGATIEVRDQAGQKDIEVFPLERTLGSLTALRFVPRGWSAEAGARYDVRVKKDEHTIAYVVEPVACP